jgi:DNA repair exonuclease SbcCD ATPase subunit
MTARGDDLDDTIESAAH